MPKLLIHTQPLGRQPRSRRDVGLMHRRTQATTTTSSIDLRSSEASWLKGCSRNSIRNKHRVCFPLAVMLPTTKRPRVRRLGDPVSLGKQVGKRGFMVFANHTETLHLRPSQFCFPTAVLSVFPEVYSRCEYSLCIQLHRETPTPRSAVKRREPDTQYGGGQARKEGTSTHGGFIVQRGSCQGLAPH